MSERYDQKARRKLERMSASPKAHRRCHGKVPHASKRRARASIRLMAADGADVSALVAYKCLTCGSWHIGNDWRSKRAAKRPRTED